MRGMLKTLSLLVSGLALSLPGAAAAEDPDFLSVGVGYYDVYQTKHEATEFRAEYRSDQKIWIFKPFAGLMATTDSAFYGYGGVLVDVFFGRRWVFTPSFAAGYYEEGDGRDLGYELEFRSSIEFSYRLDNRTRIGMAFYHLSNANYGDFNPGTEVLSIVYSIPLGAGS